MVYEGLEPEAADGNSKRPRFAKFLVFAKLAGETVKVTRGGSETFFFGEIHNGGVDIEGSICNILVYIYIYTIYLNIYIYIRISIHVYT